ncbi:PepSY domain-containing protein [Beggiatoa leptomitoformis]|uniref:PepSY domain-containing protein n=1 Tax=Beggiatoa leptomitoformis TaxID=288004 RepID=A0A2N9YCH8_9GAMM|nr:PepSY domain-containing protein [Beggiatoa leptomitoformis]ALG66528.1 hypothetical protein AL038_00720 [Beggiatoa leptomitoformis]AUI68175.1 hypothetical protein BLE401_05325 [Beggiatoa leptomitoformis]
MRLKFNARTWHAWLSIVLAIPFLIVALSAIFIYHGQALGFRDIMINVGWLPAYREAPRDDPQADIRIFIPVADGAWIGTRGGLVRQIGDTVQLIPAFAGQEIRALLPLAEKIIVLTQQGLWIEQVGEWKRISPRGFILNAFVANNQLYLALRGKALQTSQDEGKNWTAVKEFSPILAKLPPSENQSGEISVARFIRDLHTGSAIVGHDAEWVWGDVIAAIFLFLIGTGFYLWWRGQLRRLLSKRQG